MNGVDRSPPIRRPGAAGFLRPLIDEAWQRARRRRRVYAGGAFSIAVVGTIVFTVMQVLAESPGGPPAVGAGQSAQVDPSAGAPRFLAAEHVTHGVFHCVGDRGRIDLAVRFSNSGAREWDVIHGPLGPRGRGPIGLSVNTGQYALVVGGGGHVEAGGHAGAWYARLVGYVTTKRGPRQRVVIKLQSRPNGTFVVIPTQPGALERDSGTQASNWLG